MWKLRGIWWTQHLNVSEFFLFFGTLTFPLGQFYSFLAIVPRNSRCHPQGHWRLALHHWRHRGPHTHHRWEKTHFFLCGLGKELLWKFRWKQSFFSSQWITFFSVHTAEWFLFFKKRINFAFQQMRPSTPLAIAPGSSWTRSLPTGVSPGSRLSASSAEEDFLAPIGFI